MNNNQIIQVDSFNAQRQRIQQLEAALEKDFELIQWLDRCGGLGLDVHNRLRDRLDAIRAVKEGT